MPLCLQSLWSGGSHGSWAQACVRMASPIPFWVTGRTWCPKLMKWSPWANSWGRPLLTRTSTGDTQTQFWLSLCGVSGSWCIQGLFEPSDCLWRVRGLNLNAILPLLPSCWGFSFALGCRVSFWGGIQYSPVDVCSAASCSFGVLTGKYELTSFYSAILKSQNLWLCGSQQSVENS